MIENRKPLISCIVCTYNREDFITHCLHSLATQWLSKELYEIIVINNNSSDMTEKKVEDFFNQNVECKGRLIFEKKQGLSYARNKGADVAQADILTYLDDDVVADPFLLTEVLKTFRTYQFAGCVGGKINLNLPPDLPWWYSDNLSSYFSQFDLHTKSIKKITSPAELPYGANFSVLKNLLINIGGFQPALGRKGKDFSGGEELDVAYRISAQGYDLYYNPFAIVTHFIKKERIHLKHMFQTSRASAKVWVYMEQELMKNNKGIRSDLKNLMKSLIKFFFYIGAYPLKKRFQYLLQVFHNYEKVKAKLF